MSIRKERSAKGLCPNCGEMAAPYYLCDRCHTLRQVGKFCRARPDVFTYEACPEDRRKRQIGLTPYGMTKPEEVAWLRPNELDLGERGRPKLGGVPVDVLTEVIGILVRNGRPMTEEQIAEAWVKLRPRKGAGSVAENMARIIAANDKRARRLERNQSLIARSASL